MPILAMTADTIKEDRVRCLEVGMNDFVPKPIRIAQLFSVLARWLEKRAGKHDA